MYTERENTENIQFKKKKTRVDLSSGIQMRRHKKHVRITSQRMSEIKESKKSEANSSDFLILIFSWVCCF